MITSTINTITCFTNGITTGGNTLIDQKTGLTAYLPAGNAIVEVELQRRTNVALAPDAGQNISVGIAGNLLTTSVALLNLANWVGIINTIGLAPNVNTDLVIMSSAQNITAGTLYVVVKYKPISIGDRK